MQEATQTVQDAPPMMPNIPTMDDPSEIMSALDRAPDVDEDHLPRFAISALLPIPLYQMHGNNSFGDFNPKDPATGINLKTFNYYPPFKLMPLFGGTFNIPFEPNLGEHTSMPTSAPFNVESFLNSRPQGRTTVTRSPRECSEIFLRETASLGGVVLHALTGYGFSDKDKGLRRAKQLVDLLLPVGDESIFPVDNIRIRNGVPFKGPFLDELTDFLSENGLKRLRQAGIDITDAKLVEVRLYHELLASLRSNITRANRILDSSEAEMKDPNGIKKGYDLPNLEVQDAPVPQDLYCLAHTNRTELDNKALKASEAMSRGLSDPLTAALERLVGAAQPANVLTEAQIDEMFAKREAEMMARIEARGAEIQAELKEAPATSKGNK